MPQKKVPMRMCVGCRTMKEKGAPDEEVALFCLRSVLAAVSVSTSRARKTEEAHTFAAMKPA